MQRSSSKEGPRFLPPDACLSALLDGAARSVPEVDPEAYQRFRSNVSQLVQRIAVAMPAEDRLELILGVVKELEGYRAETEKAVHEAIGSWRGVVTKLFSKLMGAMGIEHQNPDAFSLSERVRHLSVAAEIRAWDELLTSFLNPKSGVAPGDDEAARLREADMSTENHNISGLNGGGMALERLDGLIKNHDRGYVVLFRLGCLELVYERFGEDAVQDAIMAVSSYLTHSLHRDDAVYHWTDNTLLAIVGRRANEHILNAELKRIVSLNRDVNINIGVRVVMLRIPIDFDTVPITQLRTPDDVKKMSLESSFSQ